MTYLVITDNLVDNLDELNRNPEKEENWVLRLEELD